MTKSISCSDGGCDCGWSATAETEEELMNKWQNTPKQTTKT